MNFQTYEEMIRALLEGKTIISTDRPRYPIFLKLINGTPHRTIPSLRPNRDWEPCPEPCTYSCWRIHEAT